MIRSLAFLKNLFLTGKKPTQADFADTLDSFRHKQDTVSINVVDLTDTNEVTYIGENDYFFVMIGGIMRKVKAVNFLTIAPPPPVPPTYFLDFFTDANSTALTAHTPDAEPSAIPWLAAINGCLINTNKAVPLDDANPSVKKPSVNVIDTGWSDFSAEAMFYKNSTSSNTYIGFIVRYTDANNYIFIGDVQGGNGFRIIKVVAGVETLLTFSGAVSCAPSGSKLKVVCIGNTITATLGSTTITATDAFNNTATKHGMRLTWEYSLVDGCDNMLIWQGDGFPPPNPLYPFILEYPNSYQVYQRSGSTGTIKIKGTIDDQGGPVDIEARFNGGSWATIDTAVTTAFEGDLTAQGEGQGDFEIRIVTDTAKYLTVPLVGVGDVYVIYGQSNASGRGDNSQLYTPTGGVQAGMFGNDYRWKLLQDNTDSDVDIVDVVSSETAHGMGAGGSYWPLLGSSIVADQSVPVAFIPASLGGAPISSLSKTSTSTDRTTLYGSMVYRSLKCFGVKAVLFHQGESDATIGGYNAAPYYKNMLKALADDIYADLGVSIIAAKIHYWTGAPSTDNTKVTSIHDQIDDAAAENVHVLIGPDLETPTIQTGLHFTQDSELQEVADRWWAILQAEFY